MSTSKSTPLDHLTFTFDIGHSSIGWAVLSKSYEDKVVSCGSVIFSPDDCQNQSRRVHRRTRRNIAARRRRVLRIGRLFKHLGVLSDADVLSKPAPWPWLMAAKALSDQMKLSWLEMWQVLRWYAHNRGYDGNRRWAKTPKDTKRNKETNMCMQELNTKTMAETVCKILGVDISSKENPKLFKQSYKSQDLAFGRDCVVDEVRQILEAHIGVLNKLDETVIRCLLEDWSCIEVPNIKAPKHYQGGLLFGQKVPRFDNRIISECRITGKKVPAKHSKEFYLYRWGMLLANIRVDDPLGERPLRARERKQIHEDMLQKGYLTKSDLEKHLKDYTHTNLDALISSEKEKEELLVDPGLKLANSNKEVKPIWKFIPEKMQRVFVNKLNKGQFGNGQPNTIGRWIDYLKTKGYAQEAQAVEEGVNKIAQKGKKGVPIDPKAILEKPLDDEKDRGRAPYCREELMKAFHDVLDDNRPDPKNRGGCLEESKIVVRENINKCLDRKTNNHLVRHRLRIFKRLLKEIYEKFANSDPKKVDAIYVEMIRDIVQFSGKNAEEKAAMIGAKLAHHKKVVKILEEQRAALGMNFPINASLIKKARIADELNWTCPFTGAIYSVVDIINGKLDREHIVPRSQRVSDSLDSLVLTYREVNKFKRDRTAYDFVYQEEGKPVPGMPNLTIQTLAQYKTFVDKLPITRSSREDEKRCLRRQKNLQRHKFNIEDDTEFTPRDLTMTSYIAKLAVEETRKKFVNTNVEYKIFAIPGQVNAEIRKHWNLTNTLAEVVPDVLNEEKEMKPKAEIRDITHLHHAVDAVTLGLASTFLPLPAEGDFWRLLLNRKLTEGDKAQLKEMCPFGIQFSEDGNVKINPPPKNVMERVKKCLAEKRVVMHVPKTMSGLKVRETIWGVEEALENGLVRVKQRAVKDRQRYLYTSKLEELESQKLLGYGRDGKLAKIKGVIKLYPNYGVALDPEPEAIQHINVWHKIHEIKKANNGKLPRILRKGQLILVEKGRYKGLWRVKSVKDAKAGVLLDIISPEFLNNFVKSVTRNCVINASLKTILKDGLQILDCGYIGIDPSCLSTLSA